MYANKYPHSVMVQFKNSGDLGTSDELGWRHMQEDLLGHVLETQGLGTCDGGQSGAGSMELFFNVANVDQAVKVLISVLTDREYIGFCKIASLKENDKAFSIHWPKDE